MFDGYLSLRSACSACGLDYQRADSGDGPAVFAVFIVGFFAVAAAFVLRFVFFAPAWLAFALSAGLAVAAILALLRPIKATLIALQYAQQSAGAGADP